MPVKTKVKSLLSFLRKVTFNNALIDVLLDFREDGMHVKALDSANIMLTDSVLYPKAFAQYEAIGKVAIPNCYKLVSLLKKKKGDIELSVSEDKLLYSLETSGAHVPLCEEKFVNSTMEELPPFMQDMPEGFALTALEFKRVMDDWNTLGAERIELSTDGTTFNMKVEDDTGYLVEEHFNVKYPAAKTVLGLSTKDLMKVVEGNITVSFKDDYPLIVTEEREGYKIVLVLASFDPESETHKKAQLEAKERQDKQAEEEKVEANEEHPDCEPDKPAENPEAANPEPAEEPTPPTEA